MLQMILVQRMPHGLEFIVVRMTSSCLSNVEELYWEKGTAQCASKGGTTHSFVVPTSTLLALISTFQTVPNLSLVLAMFELSLSLKFPTVSFFFAQTVLC